MTKNVEYIIGLRDKFSPKLAKISANMKEMGSRMKDIGKTMSVALTAPLVILGGVAVKSFDTQVKAENKLRAALKANGEQVQAVFEDYKAWAAQIQEISTIGDESTLMLLQVAQSMGLTGDTAKVAAKEAIAMSRAMNMSEQSAIRYTAALALGDATMLRRYLPSLRSIEDQTEMVTEAHRILADMFGTVTAEAQDGLGPLIQLKNSWGDFMEMIGKVIAHGIKPLIDRLKGVVKWLQDLSPATKKWIVIIGGLVAALGPLMIALGFLMTTVIPGLITGFAALFAVIAANPIGAIITVIGLAIGAFIAYNKILGKTNKEFKKLESIHKKFISQKTAEKAKLEALFGILKRTNKNTHEYKAALDEVNTIYGKYLDKKITEKTTLEDIEKAQKAATDALIKDIAVKMHQEELIKSTTAKIKAWEISTQELRNTSAKFGKLELGQLRDIIELHGGSTAAIRKYADEWGMTFFAVKDAVTRIIKANEKHGKSIKEIDDFYNLFIGTTKKLGKITGKTIKVKTELDKTELAGITRITTAAPKIFNINIEKLVETINNNVTNLKEGMNESKKIVTEALLSALSDTQIAVR